MYLRFCYFTCEATNRKIDWLHQINWAYHGSLEGGLMCSFADKELNEFKKRRDGHLEIKRAVSHVGLQGNGSWVLNNEVIIASNGKCIYTSKG